MNEQDQPRVYTESDVVKIVATTYGLRVAREELDRGHNIKEDLRGKMKFNETQHRNHLQGKRIEGQYKDAIARIDTEEKKKIELLEGLVRYFESLPKSMQDELSDLCDIDLDKVKLNFYVPGED